MENEAGAKWQGRPGRSPLKSNHSHTTGQPNLGKKGARLAAPLQRMFHFKVIKNIL